LSESRSCIDCAVPVFFEKKLADKKKCIFTKIYDKPTKMMYRFYLAA